MSADPIKLLIVDDSRIFRGVLEQGVRGEPDFRIIGSVMNGLDSDISQNIHSLTRQLVAKSRLFVGKRRSGKRVSHSKTPPPCSPGVRPLGRATAKVQAIVMGVSTGGPNALQKMLPQLCATTELPICIVQHMSPTFTRSLAKSLDGKCVHMVVEAEERMIIQRGHVYIAPGGKHFLVKKSSGQVRAVINEQPAENGCRPSVDVLFRSAVPAFDGRVLAIVLTGMGNDGTRSLGELKQGGAHIIAQDEKSSVVWGMPGSAVQSGNVDRVLPLADIPAGVAEILLLSGRR